MCGGDECICGNPRWLGVFLNHSSPWIHWSRLCQLNPELNDEVSLAGQFALGIPCFLPPLHWDYRRATTTTPMLKIWSWSSCLLTHWTALAAPEGNFSMARKTVSLDPAMPDPCDVVTFVDTCDITVNSAMNTLIYSLHFPVFTRRTCEMWCSFVGGTAILSLLEKSQRCLATCHLPPLMKVRQVLF